MKRQLRGVMSGVVLMAMTMLSSFSQEVPPSPAQQQCIQAAKDQKYTFLVFYKSPDPASQAAADTVKQFCDANPDRATFALVDVTNPAEASIVKQYAVERAPMPLVISVAPTGAVTGAFPKKVTHERLASAFVTPSMAICMKALQDGQLVFLCPLADVKSQVPQAVSDFIADPMYAKRTVVVTPLFDDAAEVELLKELKVSAPQQMVLFAPPGTYVGPFAANASKDQIATALHAAGKCCDDPNCGNNQKAAAKCCDDPNCKHNAPAAAPQATPNP